MRWSLLLTTALWVLSCAEGGAGPSPVGDGAGSGDAQDAQDAQDDVGAAGDASADVREPEAACEAALTELGEDFAEVVVAGVCGRVTLTLRDAARADCEAAGVHAVPASPGRHVVEVRPHAAVVATLEADGDPQVVAFGACPLPEGCRSEAPGEDPACAPARGTAGSVSRCGDAWLAERAPTPGASNDCSCGVDCAAAAPSCLEGACVDGRCAFSPEADGTPCSDSSLCTSGEACAGGVCLGVARVCPDAGPCAAAAVCDPKTGSCDAQSLCAEQAECTPAGCRCKPGFTGDGEVCEDIDECAEAGACPDGARCDNHLGGFTCTCPAGQFLEGGACVPAPCDCPWDAGSACGAERGRLRLTVHDLWGRPLDGATLTVSRLAPDGTSRVVAAASPGMAETALALPLCGETAIKVSATGRDHHVAEVTVRWNGMRASVDAQPSPDAAWALAEDGQGPKVALGLAHRWFAAHGPAPRDGNRLELLMDHADAWGALHADLYVTLDSVTGTSWWWDSDHELVRDAGRLDLPEAARWPDTVLGALEALDGVERRILMNQFVSQDGLLSEINVDEALLDHAERPLDAFEYMGEANTVSGRFTVAPPAVDFRARLVSAGRLEGAVVDGGAASPFSPPIAVDLNALPLGLSLVDLPLASWHQKFWTFDNAIAYVGGMNAQKVEWDGSAHQVFDPRRMAFDATPQARREVAQKAQLPDFEPYKDYMVRIDGPLVEDAVAIFHRRWEALRAAGVSHADRASEPDATPRHATHAGGVRAQLVSTGPAAASERSILESLLRAVSQARDYILIEDQYFRAPLLYDAIVARMQAVPGLRLIAVTNAVSEWTDPGCWQTALAHARFAQLFPSRFRIFRLRAFDAVRSDCFFCVDETDATFRDIVIHSKLVLIDDVYLEVGSCNSNNRGLLYEGELAVVVHDAAWVSAQRARIVSNMLGPGYAGDMPRGQLLAAFDAAAARNGAALAAWEDVGLDLDLDGDPIPGHMQPSGFVYPLAIGAPDACLIEGVGPDIM